MDSAFNGNAPCHSASPQGLGVGQLKANIYCRTNPIVKITGSTNDFALRVQASVGGLGQVMATRILELEI